MIGVVTEAVALGILAVLGILLAIAVGSVLVLAIAGLSAEIGKLI